jgi:hypothetical protein
VKSKKEIAADEAAARDAALSTSLDSTNKGFKMLASMGYKAGQALGKSEDARAEPLGIEVKEDRGGVGLASERKRKIREEMEGEFKKLKVEQEDYRERIAREREEKRNEGMMWGAMKIAEGLDTEDREEKAEQAPKPRRVNVLWRSLVRDRYRKEQERRRRHDLQQSLSRHANYDNSDEDKDDRQALGKEEVELDEDDDEELDDFEKLTHAERLEKVIAYLRDQWHYCFWCKFKYPDAEMDGCPGETEDDHD